MDAEPERGDRLEAQVRALDEGRALAHGAGLRTVALRGTDALRWANDLLSAALHRLAPGEATRTLLLSPTGRIRADVHAVRDEAALVLLQPSDHPRALESLLAPYVLSSDVRLEDRTEELEVISVQDASLLDGLRPLPGMITGRPSRLGVGADLLVPRGRSTSLVDRLRELGAVEVSPEALERWRILRGRPRFPVDLGEDSVPAEAGLEDAIDFTKGCFLGQEAVAKIRRLGHPARVVLALRAPNPVEVGAPILAGADEVGRVTSATGLGTGSALIGRVRWGARSSELATRGGAALLRPV